MAAPLVAIQKMVERGDDRVRLEVVGGRRIRSTRRDVAVDGVTCAAWGRFVFETGDAMPEPERQDPNARTRTPGPERQDPDRGPSGAH